MNTLQAGKLLSAFVSATLKKGLVAGEPPLLSLANHLENLPPRSMTVLLERTGDSIECSLKLKGRKLDRRTRAVKNEIGALIPILELSAKAGPLKSIKALLTFFEENQGMDLESIFKAMNKAASKSASAPLRKSVAKAAALSKSVEIHIADLKKAEKDKKAFAIALNELKADKSILKAQLKQIADEVSGFPQRGTKAQLYEAVERGHKYYFDAIARQKAAGNKSAA
ncbi:MAG: hypothetical protein ABJG15_04320 [Hyphomonadaceae bacterium]